MTVAGSCPQGTQSLRQGQPDWQITLQRDLCNHISVQKAQQQDRERIVISVGEGRLDKSVQRRRFLAASRKIVSTV